MKKLPLNRQTFSEFSEDGLIYVDKTAYIHRLLESGSKYFFLSRPRRFGKSLFLSTLSSVFEGRKELFEELFIYDKIKWEKHPVIHLDFSGIQYSKGASEFEVSLKRFFNRVAGIYGLSLPDVDYKDAFVLLVQQLSEKNKVVILIDEYDKPIIDFIDDIEKANINREVLRELYSTIKPLDRYIRLVFITGVSKFSRMSIFSGLNNLTDITLADPYATITGITAEELKKYFADHIAQTATEFNLTPEALLEEMKLWYNGYSWDGKTRVYNPISLLNFFNEQQFNNYWFSTGTPTFLIKLIRKNHYPIPSMERITANNKLFESYDIENLELNALLFQTGYLTVSEVELVDKTREYTLTCPNHEVRESMFEYLLADFLKLGVTAIGPLYLEMRKALYANNTDKFIQQIASLVASIPYYLHLPNEAYYHSIFYMIMSLVGIKMDGERSTISGRIDGVLETADSIYIIEFKYGKKGSDMKRLLSKAFAQIREKQYELPYLNSGKAIYHIAVVFVGKKVAGKAERGVNG